MKYTKQITLVGACLLALSTTTFAQTIDKSQAVGKGLYELTYNSGDNGVYVEIGRAHV